MRQSDRGIKSQITWIKNQLNVLEKKNPILFAGIKNEVMLELNLKYVRVPIQLRIDDLEEVYHEIRDKQINSLIISQVKDLGRHFVNRKRFISELEDMLCAYYEIVVENLKPWVKRPPKIVKDPDMKINVADVRMKNIAKKEEVDEVSLPEPESES